MTPHEAVVHMTDTFRMALGEIPIRDKSTWFLHTDHHLRQFGL